jgi:hypothetical protein
MEKIKMSKKKIGILTLYYKNVNYGALMQAFALQKKFQVWDLVVNK